MLFHLIYSSFIQYKQRDDAHEPALNFTNAAVRDHHHNNSHFHRYQRRPSLDSPHSATDSSSDDEGK